MNFLPLNDRQIKRFKEKVLICTNGCHEWQGAISPKGYGTFTVTNVDNKSTQRLSHRISFYLNGGKLEDNMVIDHKCRNRKCVNPEHLRQVTYMVNAMENSKSVAYFNSIKTHCDNGHEYTEGNTYWHVVHKGRRKYRHCRTCALESVKRYSDKATIDDYRITNETLKAENEKLREKLTLAISLVNTGRARSNFPTDSWNKGKKALGEL